MIERIIEGHVRQLATRWPVVRVTGPRQSGKTTLCRKVFPGHGYVSLEAPDVREYARTDPRGFLREHREGAIFDEVQRVPELLSYLQVEVDEDRSPGRFILSGSTHFSLLDSISQSLAGRASIVHLLPLGLDELRSFENHPAELFETLWSGAYPAIYDRNVPPPEWYASYIETYLERDVRQIQNVTDLAQFQSFLRLCAGRTGQLLDLTQIGADCGISANTAKAWLSVLETSFIAFRLRPYFRNLGKREVKTPKLYFYDTGLACALLGVRKPAEVRHHPLRGALFENWVVTEALKARLHRGLPAELYFYRDRKGLEADLLVRRGTELTAVEIKSGETVAADFFAGLEKVSKRLEGLEEITGIEKVLVYGGLERQRRSAAEVVPWSEVDGMSWG